LVQLDRNIAGLAGRKQSAHLDGEIAGISDDSLKSRRLLGQKAAAASAEARICQEPRQ
jgi:hypothetical protein